ncbi:DUF3987 domain-containing protein [Methylomagnum sp.]
MTDQEKSPTSTNAEAGLQNEINADTILAQYGAAGFNFVRIPRVAGRPTKGPTGTGWNLPRTADNPQGYTPDVAAARGWVKAGDNLGLALLPSRVASLDLDDFDEARRVFGEIGLPLADWLNDPGRVEIRSGKAGKGKLLFYVEVPDLIECSRKLVFGKRPHERAVFELRFCSKDGKTLQDVLPPSLHPDVGQPYALVGDPARMPPLPPALLKLWREWPDGLLKSFDPAYEAPPATPRPRQDRPVTEGQRDPIQEFNAVHTVESILEACGYTRKGRRWLRPGSESGIPGVTLLEGGFCYSHGGDALNDGHKHDAFDCHRLLKCGGDWAKALAWNADITQQNQAAWKNAKEATKARLTELARTLRGQGQSESRILDALLRENQAATPPLLDAEIKAVLRSSGRRGAGNAAGGGGADGPMEWPEPLLPGTAQTPEIPATLLPGWVGEMAAAVAASTQTPPALSVMAALAVLAAVLQRRFEVSPWNDDYREPLAIWTLTAAPSGSRKSAVLGALTEPLVTWEKLQRDRLRPEIARVESTREVAKKKVERLKQEAAKAKTNEDRERLRAEIQAELEAMPPELIPPRLFSGDVTGERLQQLLVEQDERMTVLTDEGGIFQVMAGLYSGGTASLDVFLQGHSGSALRVDRAGRLAHIDRPALSFGLALQPGILADAAKAKRFRDSGLLARFLYAIPRSNVGFRDVRQRLPIPAAIQQAWHVRLHELLDGMERPIGAPRVIPFTAPALAVWLDFHEMVERHQGEGRKWEAIADWTAKLPGAVARLAGLLELAVYGTDVPTIGEDSVRRAVALGELLIEHACAAFALMGAGRAEDDALAVLRWIEVNRLSGFTRREAQKAMESRFRTVDKLVAALTLLHEWGCVSDAINQPSQGGERGGRSSSFYEVNPRLLAVKAA